MHPSASRDTGRGFKELPSQLPMCIVPIMFAVARGQPQGNTSRSLFSRLLHDARDYDVRVGVHETQFTFA